MKIVILTRVVLLLSTEESNSVMDIFIAFFFNMLFLERYFYHFLLKIVIIA